jgi:predicted transcriptional regulator
MATAVRANVDNRKKGTAPAIRKMATRYPELSHSAIAKRVGCTDSNVSAVLQRFLGDRSVEDLREFQENQADVLDTIKARLLESITQSKIDKSSALQVATAYGILYDKAALLRGQATGINVIALLDVAKMIRDKHIGDANNPQTIRMSSAQLPQTLDANE